MENVVLVIHLILALAIIVLVLIQRSEGGGLGIGGGSGGGMGGFATPKGTASVLTKMTAFFATCFFITSLTLAILAGTHSGTDGILATYQEEASATVKAPTDGLEASSNDDAQAESPAEETLEDSGEQPAEEAPQEKPAVPVGE